MEQPERVHTPVLVEEVLAALSSGRSPAEARQLTGWIVDGTLGAAGHAKAILEAFPHVRLFGADQDPEMLAIAARTLAPYGDRVQLERGRMSQLSGLLAQKSITPVVGWLYDLGVNSLHFDRPERGFSFQADGPLDMRMDPSLDRTAADIVNAWDEADLADLFYYEGGERRSRRIATAICEARRRVPFLRTSALAEIISRAVGPGGSERTHPATRCFQALRRAVNEEGEELIEGLRCAERTLADQGVLAVISFHSGEDGEVKRFFQEGKRRGAWRISTKKGVAPDHQEVRRNARARSARLRVGVRLRAARMKPGSGFGSGAAGETRRDAGPDAGGKYGGGRG